jgi:hypothetical protein
MKEYSMHVASIQIFPHSMPSKLTESDGLENSKDHGLYSKKGPF